MSYYSLPLNLPFVISATLKYVGCAPAMLEREVIWQTPESREDPFATALIIIRCYMKHE